MLEILPVILFLSVGWFLHDQVALFQSTMLILIVLILLSTKKTLPKIKDKHLYTMFLIPIGYLISMFANRQNLEFALLGTYRRNFGLASWLAIALIFYLSSSRSFDTEKFIKFGLFGLFGLSLSYGTLQNFDKDPLPWKDLYSGISLTLGNPNFAGALFGMLAAVPLYFVKKNKKLLINSFYLACYLIGIYLGIRTNSVQASVLALFSTVIYLTINSNIRIASLKTKVQFAGALIFAALSIAFFLLLTSTSFHFRKAVNLDARLDYWRIGFEIWKDHPWFGGGVDAFQRYAGVYKNIDSLNRDGYAVIPDRAHNVFIDAFANGGLIVGFSLLAVVYLVLFKIFTYRKISPNRQDLRKFALLSSVFISYIFQSGISPDSLLLSAIGFISAGALMKNHETARTDKQEKIVKDGNFYRRVLAIFTLFLVLLVYSKALNANVKYREILNSEATSNSQIIKTSSNWFFVKPAEEIGVKLVEDKNNCDFIEQYSSVILRNEPRSSQAWFMRAICSNYSYNFVEAISQTNQALSLDPMNTYYLSAKAKLQIAANLPLEAKNTYLKLKILDPSNSDLPALRNSIDALTDSK